MTTVTGRVTGNVIALDERVPELEGKRVRLTVERLDDVEAVDHAALWDAWVQRGPQGPIDDDGEPEFP